MAGNMNAAVRMLLFASIAALAFSALAFAGGMSCQELSTVGYGSGTCSGTYNRCDWMVATSSCNNCGQGCTYYAGCECQEGCTAYSPPPNCICTHYSGSQPSCVPVYECQGTYNVDCSIFNNKDAACIARADSGCTWNGGIGGSCTANLGQYCVPGVNPPCCAVGLTCGGSAPNYKCCYGAGQGTCTDNSQCCPNVGLYCDNDVINPTAPTYNCLYCRSAGQTCLGSGQGNCCAGMVCNPTTFICEAPALCKNKGDICAGGPGHGNCCQPPQVPKELFCDSLNSPPQPSPTCKECAALGEKCLGSGGLDCCTAPNPSAYCDTTAPVPTCRLPTAATPICGQDRFHGVVMLSGIGALATAVLIALAYMFGELFSNARVLTWAKTEAVQIFVSLIIVGAVIGCIQAFCTLQVGEIGQLATALPPIYSAHQTASIYDAAKIYLENLMAISHTNMNAVRYSLGAYEQRTTLTYAHCPGSCWITLMGYDTADYGGETLNLALTNNLLSTATVSYLSAAFEYFTLQYILNGLFLTLLPLAIVIRSIPFMRQFGGALIAIFLSLYIFYPLMLVVDSMVTQGMTGILVVFRDSNGRGCPGLAVFGNGASCAATDSLERDLGYTFGQFVDGHIKTPVPLNEQIAANTLIFIATVFLAAVNFIVIAALARGVSHFIGDDVDISRLGQMI